MGLYYKDMFVPFSITVPSAGRTLVTGQLNISGNNMEQDRRIWFCRIYKNFILHY